MLELFINSALGGNSRLMFVSEGALHRRKKWLILAQCANVTNPRYYQPIINKQGNIFLIFELSSFFRSIPKYDINSGKWEGEE
jgi:hypothetical protein